MPNLVLDIQDLLVSHHRTDGESHTIRLPCLEVERGELVALSGDTGSGKSSIEKVVACVAEATRAALAAR